MLLGKFVLGQFLHDCICVIHHESILLFLFIAIVFQSMCKTSEKQACNQTSSGMTVKKCDFKCCFEDKCNGISAPGGGGTGTGGNGAGGNGAGGTGAGGNGAGGNGAGDNGAGGNGAGGTVVSTTTPTTSNGCSNVASFIATFTSGTVLFAKFFIH